MSEGRGRGGCGGLMHNRRGSFVDRRKREERRYMHVGGACKEGAEEG